MVNLVETMLKLHKDLPKAKTPHERETPERTIAATDRTDETLRCAQGDPAGRIDALVYELYGLTDEEVRIAEDGTRA